MDKPITVVADEFAQSVVWLANNSKLPAFVISGILHDLWEESKVLAQRQLKADNDEWQEYLEKQNNESDS